MTSIRDHSFLLDSPAVYVMERAMFCILSVLSHNYCYYRLKSIAVGHLVSLQTVYERNTVDKVKSCIQTQIFSSSIAIQMVIDKGIK